MDTGAVDDRTRGDNLAEWEVGHVLVFGIAPTATIASVAGVCLILKTLMLDSRWPTDFQPMPRSMWYVLFNMAVLL